MNAFWERIRTIWNNMPQYRRVLILGGISIIFLLLLGSTIFYFMQDKEYSPLYQKLTQEDAAAIAEKLKEMKVEYQVVEKEGIQIWVPNKQVYELRLALAAEGLPKGKGVGFEIFNKSEFGATDFVQKMNRQRALQGELERTIEQFEEVESARVMLVLARESVFIEDTKPASASVQLKLNSEFNREKVAAVVHLVAAAVEDLDPENVAVVDTRGKVLTQTPSDAEKIGELASRQLTYKREFERSLTKRIETMLEEIVGKGKAVVRVTAEMDFDQVNIEEERYDPDEQVARSQQTVNEQVERSTGPYGFVSSVNPIVPPGTPESAKETTENSRKNNQTVNFEISRTVRHTVKPMVALRRLSVAAVLDGHYDIQEDKDGNRIRKYRPRSQDELEQFRSVVRNAMGYNADREDQVTVESFPFWSAEGEGIIAKQKEFFSTDNKLLGYIIGFIVIILAWLVIVRPTTKTILEMRKPPEEALPPPEGLEALPKLEDLSALPEPAEVTPREKAMYLARQDVEKTANLLKTWLRESYL